MPSSLHVKKREGSFVLQNTLIESPTPVYQAGLVPRPQEAEDWVQRLVLPGLGGTLLSQGRQARGLPEAYSTFLTR